jgi:tight adherence protein B
MDTLLLTFALVGFLAVVLLLEGGFMLWNSSRSAEARRLQDRLRLLATGERLSVDSQILRQDLMKQMPAAYRLLFGAQRLQRLDRLLLQSGLKRTVPSLLGLCVGGAIVGLVLGIFLPLPWWAAPALAAGIGSLPYLQVMHARRRRLHAIEQQLPDALDLMSRALRAGHAFPSAVQMTGTEGPEPIAGEFRITFDEVNYGVPMQDALANLATRVPVTDLRFFVIAVAIQRETGGNLTELLDKLSALIRERFKLLGTIRVLSSEGRLSAWILSALPFVLVGLINFINPKFMGLLWNDPGGLIAVYISLGLMVTGIFWMTRIVKIRV